MGTYFEPYLGPWGPKASILSERGLSCGAVYHPLLYHVVGWITFTHSGINYWLKARLLDAVPVGEYAAFWLGGTTDV